MAKYFQLITLLVLFLGIFSCSKGYEVPNDYIRIHLDAEPTTLHPVLATDGYAGQVNQYLFDSMIKVDPDTLERIPNIATHWDISNDNKVFTFYLRKDVNWHDGKPVTADDIVFSYEYIKKPSTNAPYLKVYYKDLERMEKVDDYTVRCHYKKPYFLALTFCGGISILPKHLLENVKEHSKNPFSRAPLGNGPYIFKEWITNTRIVLKRNEKYWGKKPEIKTIEFKIISDKSIALQVMKKGLLDLLAIREIQWMKQTNSPKFLKKFRKISYPKPGYSYLGWNQRKIYFKDKRVRKAMTYLIDRKKINEKIKYGLSTEVTGPFFPPSKQYNKDLKPYEYNPKKAKKLLHAAGWIDSNGDGVLDKNGRSFKFNILYPSGSKFSERFSTIFKEELKKVGIEVTISRMEWAAFLDQLYKRNYDMAPLAWGAPFESDPYQVWHSSQADAKGSSNHIGFVNKEADRLMELARVEFDEDKRNEYFRAFHKILYDEQPYTFLYSDPALVIVSKRFKNVIVHKAGLDILEWKVRKDE